MLNIERGQRARYITTLHWRLCPSTHEIEDEKHFAFGYPTYKDEGDELCDEMQNVNLSPVELMPNNDFVSVLASNHRQITNWFPKFMYVCFGKRSKFNRSTDLKES